MDKLLSVKEFADQTGKDPGYLRKMLIAGRLDGVKVGNQWCIPMSAKLPEDARVKTGKYKNWRNKRADAGQEA